MFNKKTTIFLCVMAALLIFSAPSLEAGCHKRRPHCNRTNISVNVSPTYVRPAPTYVEMSPTCVVERYYDPLYAVPVREVVVYQQPVYRPVYVSSPPQTRLFTGLSFNWFFR